MSRYTLDSNILIALEQRYPRDFLPSLWERFEELAEAGDICICDAVMGEVDRSDSMKNWVIGFPNFVCKPTTDEMDTVRQISETYPGWVQDTKNAADPWIVAHGVHDGCTIVTEEKKKGSVGKPENQKIPNVAADFVVTTMNFFEFAKSQGWRF